MGSRQPPLVERIWAPEIIEALAAGPLHFNDLLRGIRGINDRILAVRVRELEAAGLIARVVIAGPPVRVSYGLSVNGRRFVEPIRAFRALQAVCL